MDSNILIMAIMTVATVASAIVAGYSVWDTRCRYIDSILPIISFKLFPENEYLNLKVLNAGKSPARNLTIQIIHIYLTNLDHDSYCSKNDDLSGVTFDLFPDEVVCNRIANLPLAKMGVNIIVLPGKPLVKLKLSYVDDWDNKVTEERTVFVCR